MRTFQAMLTAGAALSMMAGPAAAFDVQNSFDVIEVVEVFNPVFHPNVPLVDNKLELHQLNAGHTSSELGLNVTGAVTSVEGSAVAVGNSQSVDLGGSLALISSQANWGDASAVANVNIETAIGNTAEVAAIAIGNNLIATFGGGVGGLASASQVNHGNVSAAVGAGVNGGFSADVTTTALAAGNNAGLTIEGDTLTASLSQVNTGNVSAANHTHVNATASGVTATATALGNAISIANR